VLGSVAEEVIRKAPCPVLAAKFPAAGEGNAQIRRILHPTDFSVRSETALHLASWLAREYKAPLTVLHVVERPAVVFGEAIVDVSSEIDAATAKRRLAEMKPTVPVHQFKTELREGDPGTQVLEAAKADHSDLIVIATHGRTGFGRLLMGSVAEHVLRNAPCALLSVKTPLPAT
jgi:nucleotide-binding universal stress UspA family protein